MIEVRRALHRPDGITDAVWKLIAEADEALGRLDQIDIQYRRERNKIRNALNGTQTKQRLLRGVHVRWREKREPVVEQLVKLRRRLQQKI